jgi:hypothetical protein
MTSNGFDQAYKSVELAYSQSRFEEALQDGEQLLAQSTLDPGDPHILRLKLLLGHIHFYGLRHPAEASGLYREVLASTSGESTYTELAAEGLVLCEQSTKEAELGPAMPWVTDLEPLAPPALRLLEGAQDTDTDDGGAEPAWATRAEAAQVEPVRVEVLAEAGMASAEDTGQPRFSPEEEAELAKGLLRVVLR